MLFFHSFKNPGLNQFTSRSHAKIVHCIGQAWWLTFLETWDWSTNWQWGVSTQVSPLSSFYKRNVNNRIAGMIILGGGLIKHHICNANLMRNGADFSLFVNTASEFDGSDSGARWDYKYFHWTENNPLILFSRPDEAISWGKIRKDATPVKVYAEISLVFPLIVAETFAKRHHSK